MNYIQGKTVVITGISKGIGRCLTEVALEQGMQVIGWGRNEPDYDADGLTYIPCDVSQSEQIKAAAEKSLALTGEINFLVNNAGFGYFSPLQDFEEEVFRRMWEVNVLGAFLSAKALVPHLLERGSGHIVNISSIAGRVGAPWGSSYNATKFALTGMGESWFHELRKQGIKVTNVYPGSTATHFFDEIPSVDVHANMLDPREVATAILNVMNTSPNFLVRDIELRPLKSKPK